MVEWLEQKLSWLGERGSELSTGCRRLSKTLTAGERRKTWRLPVPKSAGLLCLGAGFMIGSFQMARIVQWLMRGFKGNEVLKFLGVKASEVMKRQVI